MIKEQVSFLTEHYFSQRNVTTAGPIYLWETFSPIKQLLIINNPTASISLPSSVCTELSVSISAAINPATFIKPGLITPQLG